GYPRRSRAPWEGGARPLTSRRLTTSSRRSGPCSPGSGTPDGGASRFTFRSRRTNYSVPKRSIRVPVTSGEKHSKVLQASARNNRHGGVVVTALAGSQPAAADTDPGAAGIPGGSPGQAPIVVYIAGSGRSGSTLLERALGEVPGFVNVGELIDLYRRTAAQDERCGCGAAFAECPFWARVGDRAFGGWPGQKLAATHGLQNGVARQRRMPRLLAMPLAGRQFRADVAAYGASYDVLYHAIAAEAGAACVVDASKWPVQALALARAGLDVRVIHLVRDVRGVAYSLGKRDVSRPHAVREADVMSHLSPALAAARGGGGPSGARRACSAGAAFRSPGCAMRSSSGIRGPRWRRRWLASAWRRRRRTWPTSVPGGSS